MHLPLPYKPLCLLAILLLAGISQLLTAQVATEPAQSEIGPAPSDASIERWDRLALKDNNLRPDPPVQGQTDTFPTFTRELVRVQWRTGDPIDLYIVRPTGIARPRVILYLYGYPREAVRFLDPEFCRAVTKNGFAAVGFSSMLTGQRYHDVPMKIWFVSELEHTLVGTAHDLQMTINYLEQRGDFDTSRVGVFGEGSGGTIALLAASVDSRIGAVDLLNPWGDWSDWFAKSQIVPESERPRYLTKEFQQSIAPLNPVTLLPSFSRAALRLQQTLWTSDATPVISRNRIAAALPSTAMLVQYKDAQEYADNAGRGGKMLDWLSRVLSQAIPAHPPL
jgi:hypothetical protein